MFTHDENNEGGEEGYIYSVQKKGRGRCQKKEKRGNINSASAFFYS